MERGKWWRRSLAVAASLVFLAGCGDTNLFEGSSNASGSEAKMEEGIQAINDENWDEAIRIFSEMDTSDPDVRKYLASAYLGRAGFDTLELVDEIAAAQEDDRDIEFYDVVTRIFDEDGDGKLTEADLNDKIDDVESALDVYLGAGAAPLGRVAALTADEIGELEAIREGLTDNEVFQLGLFSAIHAVLSVVEQLEDPENPGRTYLLTVAALKENPEVIDSVEVPEGFDRDLWWTREAVGVVSPELVGSNAEDGNDIAEELDKFLIRVGFLEEPLDSPQDFTVEASELRCYLKSIAGIGDSCQDI